MIELGLLLILVVATEAVTEIIVASEFPLFLWIRTRLGQRALPETPRNDFRQYALVALYKLFTCGYCFSVWTAGFFALFAPKVFDHTFVNWMCATFLLHRLANWLHVVTQLVWKGRVISHDIEVSLKIIDPEEEDEEDLNLNEFLEGEDGES